MIPQDPSNYVHRIGRTGRAGMKEELSVLWFLRLWVPRHYWTDEESIQKEALTNDMFILTLVKALNLERKPGKSWPGKIKKERIIRKGYMKQKSGEKR